MRLRMVSVNEYVINAGLPTSMNRLIKIPQGAFGLEGKLSSQREPWKALVKRHTVMPIADGVKWYSHAAELDRGRSWGFGVVGREDRIRRHRPTLDRCSYERVET